MYAVQLLAMDCRVATILAMTRAVIANEVKQSTSQTTQYCRHHAAL